MIIVRERYDPLGKENLRYLEPEEWAGRSIYDLIPAHVRSSRATVQVVRNGRDLHDEDLHEPLTDEDHLTIRLVPQIAVVAFVFWGIIVPAVIGIAVGYAVNALINLIVGKPRKPRVGTDSPTYDFDTPQNTTANGTPISVVYGQVRVAGHLLQVKTKSFREDAVNRVSVNLLVGIGEGGEEGYESICGRTSPEDNILSRLIDSQLVLPAPSNLEINGNPASTYRDVFFSVRMGTKHQAIIAGFEDTVVKTNVLESILTYGATAVTVTTDNFVDAVEVKWKFPQGLFILNKDGNLVYHVVLLRVRWKPLGATDWSGDKVITVSGATRQPFVVSRRITKLHQARMVIELSRISSEAQRFQVTQFPDTTGFKDLADIFNDPAVTSIPVLIDKQQSQVEVIEVSEIINDDLAYPGTALGAVTALATDQLHGSQPNVTFKVKGLRIKVYSTPTAYTYQWTQNPSWVLLDLITHPVYGLGDQGWDPLIDDFIAFAAYCDASVSDGKGGVEPRNQVDVVIDQTRDAWDWIYEVALTCQAVIFISGGKLRVKADTTMDPVMMFNPGNMMTFTAGYTPPKNRINYVEVAYFDRDLNYRREMVVELDPSIQNISDYVRESIELVGVTRRSQAHRIGVYRINANKLAVRYAKWTAEVAAVRCEPGDVVEVAHDSVRWGLLSGLVVTAQAGSITLDREMLIESGKSYQVRVFHTGGTFDTLPVISTPGTYTQLAVSGAWTTTPVQYRPYTVGEAGLVSRLFKVVEMTLKADYTVELSGLEYNSLIYSDTIITLPGTPTNLGVDPRQAPPDASDLKVTQRQEVQADGSLEIILDVNWNPPVSAAYASSSVWLRDATAIKLGADGSYEAAWPNTPATADARGGYARVTGNFVLGQTVEIAVTTKSIWGISKEPIASPKVTVSFSLAGQIPGDVTGFGVTRHIDTLKFMWDAAPDFSIVGYEIRQAGTSLSWEGAAILVSGTSATSFETSIFFAQNTVYTATFLIKAINAAGIYSQNPTSIALAIDPRLDHNVVESRDYRTLDWPLGTRFNFVLGSGSAGARNLELSPGVSDLHTITLKPAMERPLSYRDWPRVASWISFIDSRQRPFRAGKSETQLATILPGFATFTQVHQQTLGIFEGAEIDLGAVLRVLTSAFIQANQFNPSLTWANDTFTWGDPAVATETWAGTDTEAHLEAHVEWRFGNSTPLLGAYQELLPTDSSYRYAQFRAVLELTDPNFDGSLEEFKVLIDVPDVIDSGSGTTDGSGILNVTFVKTYYRASSISRGVTVKLLPQGGYFEVSNESVSGFRVTVKNSGGTGLSGKIVDWLSKGF